MAKCKLCGKRGWLFHPLKLNSDGICKECSDARQKFAQRVIKTPLKGEEKEKIFRPPIVQNGNCLVYSYTNVGFYCPDECLAAAKAVPPHQQLTLKYEPDNAYDKKAIAIYYKDDKIGYMYKGKIRDMLKDFAKHDSKDFLPVSLEWTDTPVYNIYFYQRLGSIKFQMKKDPNYKEFPLTDCTDAITQGTIECYEAGYPVTIDPNKYNNRHAVTCCASEIGYCPATANSYLDKYTKFDARISAIGKNASGKLVPHIMVVPIESTPEE